MSPYEALGVPPSTTLREAERVYRRRIRRAHPDVGGSEAEAKRLTWAIHELRTRPLAWTHASVRQAEARPRPAATTVRRDHVGRYTTNPVSPPIPARPKRGGIPTWFVVLVVVCVGLVLAVAYWQLIALSVVTIWAAITIMSAFSR